MTCPYRFTSDEGTGYCKLAGVTAVTWAAMRAMLAELANDLENEIDNRYAHTKSHPTMQARRGRDMAVVVRARELLNPTASKGGK